MNLYRNRHLISRQREIPLSSYESAFATATNNMSAEYMKVLTTLGSIMTTNADQTRDILYALQSASDTRYNSTYQTRHYTRMANEKISIDDLNEQVLELGKIVIQIKKCQKIYSELIKLRLDRAKKTK